MLQKIISTWFITLLILVGMVYSLTLIPDKPISTQIIESKYAFWFTVDSVHHLKAQPNYTIDINYLENDLFSDGSINVPGKSIRTEEYKYSIFGKVSKYKNKSALMCDSIIISSPKWIEFSGSVFVYNNEPVCVVGDNFVIGYEISEVIVDSLTQKELVDDLIFNELPHSFDSN